MLLLLNGADAYSPIISFVKKQLKKAIKGLIIGQIYCAKMLVSEFFIFIGIEGMTKKKIRLKKGNNLNAVLDF